MSIARDEFLSQRRPTWDALEALLLRDRLSATQWSELAGLYRAVCADLSRARSLQLGEDVSQYLDQLAARGHNALYGARQRSASGVIEFFAREVPREVRASWKWFLLANLVFYGPFLVGIIGALASPAFATAVLPPEMLSGMEDMYRNPEMVRDNGEDAMMAGFYVFNNVGIAFRCFATGALGGLGSLYFLFYNGLVMGVVFGYLGRQGVAGNLLQFAIGHGPWELTAIVLAGAAGLRMGWALIETGGRTRAGSLRHEGPALFRLILGAAGMLFIAAAIEAFWSAGPVPVIGKYLFGFVQIAIVTLWLSLGGRK